MMEEERGCDESCACACDSSVTELRALDTMKGAGTGAGNDLKWGNEEEEEDDDDEHREGADLSTGGAVIADVSTTGAKRRTVTIWLFALSILTSTTRESGTGALAELVLSRLLPLYVCEG